MDRKYQVFISSTFNDLKEERVEIMEALINLGHIPIGMELFNAADDTQWGVIKRRIEESDYYVLILSDRYGSLDADGVGFTEKEYNYAIETGIPIISFVRSDSEIEKLDFEFRESDNKSKLKEFREKISKRLYKPWDNKYDLSKKFFLAFADLIREKPQLGWIKADKQEEIKKQQFNSIFNENELLKEKLKACQKELNDTNKKVEKNNSLELKSKLIMERLKSSKYSVNNYTFTGFEVIAIFGGFFSSKTTKEKLDRSIQEFIANLIEEEYPHTIDVSNLSGIFSSLGLTNNELVSYQEEDSHGKHHYHKRQEHIEYISPSDLFFIVYMKIPEVNAHEIIKSKIDYSFKLKQRLSTLLDFNLNMSHTEQKRISYKKQKIETIIVEFLSEYEWNSEQEKQEFLSKDFMSDKNALIELASKANEVIELQKPHKK